MSRIYCVIMAGGIGSRFWPQSTPERPKQFLDILNEGLTMLQQTVERAKRFCSVSEIVVVTSQAYRPLVEEQLPELSAHQIMGEPCMRNTASCIAWAVWKISRHDPEACILVVPSDSYIPDAEQFARDVARGAQQVNAHPVIMTFGIEPTGAETGYGYIEAGEAIDAGRIFTVNAFREKPSLATAQEYLRQGNYYWNAGIFMSRASTFKDAFWHYLPEIATAFDSGDTVYNTAEEQSFIDKLFPACPAISIDHGIMEKATNICVMEASFRWSDVGAWNAVHGLQRKDDHNNTLFDESDSRRVIYENTSNCLVSLPEGTQAVIEGVKDLIIVQLGNRLLICTKDNEQQIKEYVRRIGR